MLAKLVTDWFGGFGIGDDSEADCMYQMIMQALEYQRTYEADFKAKGTECN